MAGRAIGERIMSTPGSASTSCGSSSSTSAPVQLEWLPRSTPRYTCVDCGTHLALQDELISKSFSGRDGKAYLFASTLNTQLGAKEERHLLTGMHTVCDLSCLGCGRTLGWFYLKAWEHSQKYKEGKWIMEKASLHKVNAW